MRTKTLLLAAAALVGGAIASSAQVYSANVVGYINLTLQPGYNLIANQLTNGNNNISVVFSGLPASLDGATVQGWSFAGQTFTQADTYYDGAGWLDGDFNASTTTIRPGLGYMFYNPAAAAVTVTLIGEVPQGSTTTSIQGPGYGLYSSVPPVVSGFSTNGFPTADGMTYQTFTGTAYSQAITYYDGAGWLDGDFNNADPAPAVGVGFLISNPGPAKDWVRNFTVQ